MTLGMLVSQTASAYKYYIHTGSGNVILVNADNAETAISLFNSLIGEGVLDGSTEKKKKRPNGGCIAGCDNNH